MIVDRDSHWPKSLCASVARRLSLQVLLSTSHHPQHDGQMECQNQTLEIALHVYVMGLKADWARWLPALAFAYNSTLQLSTGYSPFFLLYGYEPASPQKTPIECLPLCNQATQDFIQMLEDHQALASHSLVKAPAWHA